MPDPALVPASTYRLQIRSSLTLDDAATLTDYLAELGVDAVYLSPLLQATAGSDHGYDVVNPTTIDPERGGAGGWHAFVAAARRRRLKIVVDIVPNHLGIARPEQNRAWWSVLAEGPASPYATWFDIDWSRAPVVVPILGEDVTPGELRIERAGSGFVLRYHEHTLPIAEGTYTPGAAVGDVLSRQHYRLVGAHDANTAVNYRRFFAVSTLAGVRIEDADVFRATHGRVLRWVQDDRIEGLRVDHPDGLLDPAGYLERLRAEAPQTWLVVEKILEPGEDLPPWPVDGTSGYDALAEVSPVFVDTAAAERFTGFYQRLTGDIRSLHEHVLAGKTQAAEELLPAEIGRLAALAALTHPQLDGAAVRSALVQLAAHMEVYRSYLPLGAGYLDRALAASKHDMPSLGDVLDVLSPRLHDPADELALRFQQLSGAVMAKGVEDTAYYRYSRFIALNEVGGNPAQFGSDVDSFHEAMRRRQQRLPASMTTLSTHDTKRGEDVRARLAVLSELPEQWERFARRFVNDSGISDRPFAYLLAQTLVGVGPIARGRLHAYAEKAMREANTATSWASPVAPFEDSVHACVDAWLDDPEQQRVWQDMLAMVEAPGWSNALGAKLVQLTMPGCPDVYQGTELWEDSLVDPDNRRAVDFDARRALLGLTQPPPLDASGSAKFWVVRAALQLKKQHRELFTGYTPVAAQGAGAGHVLAFDRGGAVTVATRLPVRLARDGWQGSTLPLSGSWTDVLTGRGHTGTVQLAGLLDVLPVALLVRTDPVEG